VSLKLSNIHDEDAAVVAALLRRLGLARTQRAACRRRAYSQWS